MPIHAAPPSFVIRRQCPCVSYVERLVTAGAFSGRLLLDGLCRAVHVPTCEIRQFIQGTVYLIVVSDTDVVRVSASELSP